LLNDKHLEIAKYLLQINQNINIDPNGTEVYTFSKMELSRSDKFFIIILLYTSYSKFILYLIFLKTDFYYLFLYVFKMECLNLISSLEKVTKCLDLYGVVIIENILSSEECDNMNTVMKSTLNHLTFGTFNFDDINSWHSFFDLYPNHNMLLQHHSIGNSQYVWDIRQNPKVVNFFSTIWNCEPEELLTSFDGVSIHLPPEITNKWYRHREKDWLHCDQSFLKNDKESIQGWVTANDVNFGDATLVVLIGSHKYHKEFSEYKQKEILDEAIHLEVGQKTDHLKKCVKEKIKKTFPDWYKLSDEDIICFLRKGCDRKYIKCPAGSMVLWNSRTIHSGSGVDINRPNQNFRNIVYTCMTPRNMSTKLNIKKHIKAFEELRMTNHYPHRGKLFPVKTYTRGKELEPVNKIDRPVLTFLGLKLLIGKYVFPDCLTKNFDSYNNLFNRKNLIIRIFISAYFWNLKALNFLIQILEYFSFKVKTCECISEEIIVSGFEEYIKAGKCILLNDAK
jgi:hypothetical protein